MKMTHITKRIVTLLLAAIMICGLFASVSFAEELPKVTIRIEAENPTEKYVDMENRTDVNGNPMDHSVRQLAEDGLQYVGQDAINFAAFDWYTYTFNVETAGVYKLSVRAASDRNSPFNYKLDGADTWTSASMTSNGHTFDVQVLVASMELTAGQHTITFTNTINKNHNAYTDYYELELLEGVVLPETIRIEAEKPSDKIVDLENRGFADHSSRNLAEDGLQYEYDGVINFAAFDQYTYTFNVETAGVYKLSVYAASDRNSPFNYKLDDSADWIAAAMTANSYKIDLQVLVEEMYLTAGQHTITFTNTTAKNYNTSTDYYVLELNESGEKPKATSVKIEAERPSDKFVDMQNLGFADHTTRSLAADGLEYADSTAIYFRVKDWYTYTFTVEIAGTYNLSAMVGSDRNCPFDYKLDGASEWTPAAMAANSWQNGLQVLAEEIYLTVGEHTITFINDGAKNYAAYTDYYLFDLVAEGEPPVVEPPKEGGDSFPITMLMIAMMASATGFAVVLNKKKF